MPSLLSIAPRLARLAGRSSPSFRYALALCAVVSTLSAGTGCAWPSAPRASCVASIAFDLRGEDRAEERDAVGVDASRPTLEPEREQGVELEPPEPFEDPTFDVAGYVRAFEPRASRRR